MLKGWKVLTTNNGVRPETTAKLTHNLHTKNGNINKNHTKEFGDYPQHIAKYPY